MIRFKMFPVIFFVMVFSSCHLMAKDKRAENNSGEETATRGLAAAGEPLYQICSKGMDLNDYSNRSRSSFVEIIGGKTGHSDPAKVFAGSAECVWIKKSQFRQLSIRLVEMHQYGKADINQNNNSVSSSFNILMSHICGPLGPYWQGRCRAINYIFRSNGTHRTTETIPQPDLPKSHTYPSPVNLRGL